VSISIEHYAGYSVFVGITRLAAIDCTQANYAMRFNLGRESLSLRQILLSITYRPWCLFGASKRVHFHPQDAGNPEREALLQ
jgi:hypothetical protein